MEKRLSITIVASKEEEIFFHNKLIYINVTLIETTGILF